jgi:hypothetical protein
VWIISLITNERYAGLRATTDSGIEGKIGIDDIRVKYTTPPEKLKSIARVNMSLCGRYRIAVKMLYINQNIFTIS